jgi:drug/metabolite transporter (DMT)-like permease
MKPPARARAYLPVVASTSTSLFWGLSYAVTKGLLQSMTAIEIAVLRFLLASVALVITAAFTGSLKPVKRAHWPRAIAAGVIGISVYFMFENNGLRLTSASAGSLIIATIPILNLIVSWLTRGERVTVLNTAGVLLSFSGVYLLVRLSSGPSDGSSLAGNLLVLGAAVSWVAYTRINAPLVKEYDLATLNTIETCIGTAALIPVGLAAGVSFPELKADTLLGLAYLGLICSAAAYFLYFVALRALGSVTVTCFVNLVPVFGVLGAVVFLGERITADKLLGGLMILAGVALVTIQAPQDRGASLTARSDTAPC